MAVATQILGMDEQTLDNEIKDRRLGKLAGADRTPVVVEQMEINRLRVSFDKPEMERD